MELPIHEVEDRYLPVLTIERIKDELEKEHFFLIKYVRIGDEFRFETNNFFAPSHANMVKEGETATSAGYVNLKKLKGIYHVVPNEYSSTLKLWPAIEDGELIAKLLDLSPAITR